MRLDHMLIKRYISKESRVLDLGCGDGELLQILKSEKNVRGIGIDINEKKILSCLSKGISVIQSNIDNGLKDYANGSFDYVIINDTLQTVHNPIKVIHEATRVGKKVIVTFPNFAHYIVRFNLLLSGKMPKSNDLPYEWYNTPNIHLFTIKDFRDLCKKNKIKILEEFFYSKKNKIGIDRLLLPNFLARNALFVVAYEKS